MRQNWFCPVYNSQNLTRASGPSALEWRTRASGPSGYNTACNVFGQFASAFDPPGSCLRPCTPLLHGAT